MAFAPSASAVKDLWDWFTWSYSEAWNPINKEESLSPAMTKAFRWVHELTLGRILQLDGDSLLGLWIEIWKSHPTEHVEAPN